jgi:predicted P-loop ATPase
MQEKELKYTKKRRNIEAPYCPCGEVNKKDKLHFAPFEGVDGKYGYCHSCKKSFMPENTDDVTYVYTPPDKAEQKFIPEQEWNWIFQDVMISPRPEAPVNFTGQYKVTFYFRNVKGKLASAKTMTYNFPKFKRDPEKHPIFPYTRDSGYYPCLFYERDLELFPKATVILVESEKTAALLRYKFKEYLAEFIYLGVGGANGLTDEKMAVLKDRDIIICYDCDNGDPQADGSIKKPKGREAAQSTYVRLAPICRPIVVDIDPTNTDGLDLGDIAKTIDIEYIRDLHTLEVTATKIPEALITELRLFNKNGEAISPEVIDQLGREHNINADKIREMTKVVEKQFKAEEGISQAPIVRRIEHWLEQRYDFRHNTLNNKIFFRKKGEVKYDDCKLPVIWRAVNHNVNDILKGKRKDSKIPVNDIDLILQSDFTEKFNPVRDYFESLPAWDNIDHISALAEHIQTDDQEYWLQQFKKSLVRMLACTLDNEVNRIIMTLVQEAQESGKSSFIRFLCPPALKDYYKESPMDHDKDTEIALTENFIWNLEELADLNKKQISEMKAIVSMDIVKRRRPHGKGEEPMKRMVNFWGSTNKTDFLADTQNSRWLCFNILSISHDYNNSRTGVKNVDINKVWGQAYHLYKTGFEYTMTVKEREKRDHRNQMFEAMPEEKQMILRFFKPARKVDHGAKFLVNYEIKEHLNQHTSAKTRVNDHNIARSMKQLGFIQEVQRYQGKPARGYWVIPQSSAIEIDPDMPAPDLFGTQIDDEPIDLPF